MPTPTRRRAVSLAQALTRCEVMRRKVRDGRVIPVRDKKRLVEAAELVLRKDESSYESYLREVQRVGDSGLVFLVALALGKSTVANMKNADKSQLPSGMKQRSCASEALTKLVELHFAQPRHHLDQEEDQANHRSMEPRHRSTCSNQQTRRHQMLLHVYSQTGDWYQPARTCTTAS
ncbi:hypothetical protein OCU04_005657 [Sclerotinia nivalis]|uniref:Uncharacterized protein n=1 Tax=Sclerotinia nivalis TaxID=352851 RepID=A0A9X0AQ04_9HELO|nr:hypothetical protein OCU04_005657 [Sclerotinia nivalis]